MNNTDDTSMDDLAVLLPEAHQVQAGGKMLVVLPAPFRVSLRMLAVAGPLIEAVQLAGAAGDVTTDQIMDIMTRHAEAVAPLCAIATGESQSFIDSLEPEAGMRVFAAVLKANADFFHALVLQVMAALSRVPGKSSSSAPTKLDASRLASAPSSQP